VTRRACALVVAVAATTGGCTHARVQGLAPVRATLFDASGRVERGPYGAMFSPDGARLAVKSGRGISIVTSRGHTRLVTPPGSRAVDYAWLPAGNDLLIAEGPSATGRLEVLALDGAGRGSVPLDPSFSVGTGYGMAVAPDGHHAVAVAEDLVALGGPERLSLVRVDLATGTVEQLPVKAVRGPAYIDAEHVLLTSLAATGSRAEVLTLATAQRRPVSPAGESADALGPVLRGRWLVYATERAVWAVPAAGGARVRLAGVARGATAVAVDPDGTQAIVAERNGDVEQLRAVSLRALPAAPG
jgi:DNA-binding beta-propeller fold protein YncE